MGSGESSYNPAFLSCSDFWVGWVVGWVGLWLRVGLCLFRYCGCYVSISGFVSLGLWFGVGLVRVFYMLSPLFVGLPWLWGCPFCPSGLSSGLSGQAVGVLL